MTFKSSLPTAAETRRMTAIESSRRIVDAFNEARSELRRLGRRDTLAEAAKLLGKTGSGSTSSYQLAQAHIRAVEIYGISENLAKQEAVRRMTLIDPLPGRLSIDLEEAQERRSDPEILADAISKLLIRAGKELAEFDARHLAAFLNRDPLKRGATRSALVDLRGWLDKFEKALEKER